MQQQEIVIKKRERALSDQFNDNRENITKLEKELQDKFENMFQQNDKPKQQQIDPLQKLLSQLEGEFGSVTIGERRKSFDNLNADLTTMKGNPPGINIKVGTPQIDTPSRLPYILDESNERHNGKLKFFDERKNYGFLLMDSDNSDVFVHQDDLNAAGITIEKIRAYANIKEYLLFKSKKTPSCSELCEQITSGALNIFHFDDIHGKVQQEQKSNRFKVIKLIYNEYYKNKIMQSVLKQPNQRGFLLYQLLLQPYLLLLLCFPNIIT
ncbi:hypothetical protein pb186bvf_010503 [Paramecium bursaria]